MSEQVGNGTPNPPHPFRSSRLLYRAIEPEDDYFIIRMQQSTVSYQNYNCSLPKPKSTTDAVGSRKRLEEDTDRLLTVMICLPKTDGTNISGTNSISTILNTTTAIGLLTLTPPDPSRQHHRLALIGLFLLDEYQGRGYGSEAIRWSLQWGFEMAGLHRIGIECVGWSEGLLRLYKKLGFNEEGVLKDFYWFRGQWWNYHLLAMLEGEWRGLRDATEDWKPTE